MNRHRRRLQWVSMTALPVILIAGLIIPVLGGQSPTVDRNAISLAPPIRPDVSRTPPASTSYVRQLSPDAKIPAHALRVFGNGEVEIEGAVDMRFSGECTLWIDQATSMIIDPATTGTLIPERDFRRFVNFKGTVGLKGNNVKMKAQGQKLMIIGNGKGKVTMAGESGMFRLTQAGRKQVSGVWTEAGTSVDFETITTRPVADGMLYGPSGIIPMAPPSDARQYERAQLPSEHDTVATGALSPARPIPPKPVGIVRTPMRTPVPTPVPTPTPGPTTGTAPTAVPTPAATPPPAGQ